MFKNFFIKTHARTFILLMLSLFSLCVMATYSYLQKQYALHCYYTSSTPPSADERFPIPHATRTCYLKNIIKNPQIVVGDYTYYDDPESVNNFEKNVLYLFDFMQDKLIIGKFCQIGSGVRFIMNGALHDLKGFSTYPFKAFGKAWGSAPMNPPYKGNTVVGNDVWIGNNATIMPGVTIGDGAIVGTNAVVTKNVDPYTIVAGNPARVIRKRFDDETRTLLLKIAWWDWPIEKITQHLHLITSGNTEKLKLFCEDNSSPATHS